MLVQKQSPRFARAGAVFYEDFHPAKGLLSNRYTVNGSPDLVRTPWGFGMSFDGTNDYLTVNNPTTGLTALTISMLVYVDTSTFNGSFATILDDTALSTSDYGFYFIVDDRGSPTNGFVVGMKGATNGFGITNSNIFTAPDWYNIAFTYNSSSKLLLYFNGQNVTNSQGDITGNLVSSPNPLGIGATYLGTFNKLTGKIASITIFPTALTAEEVSILHNS